MIGIDLIYKRKIKTNQDTQCYDCAASEGSTDPNIIMKKDNINKYSLVYYAY